MADKLTNEQIAEENRQANDLPNDRAEPAREPAAEAPEPREAERETEKKEIPVGSKFANKRDSIYKKHRDRREPAEGEEEFAAVPPDREKVFFGQDVETRSDREARRAQAREEASRPEPAEQPAAEEPPVEQPAQTRQRLKVNGREVELSDDEVRAYAQKAIAAEDILGQAKQVRAEQQSILEELRNARAHQSQDGKQPSTPQGATEPETQPDDDELDDIIDKLQVGDPAEAKAALRKYGESLENRLIERIGNLDERIADTTRTLSEISDRQRQTRETLEEFGKDYPEFNESVPLQTALAHETASRMKQAMLDIGVREETLDGIKRKYGYDDNQTVAFAYRTLQQQDYELKDHATLLREAAEGLRQTFGAKPEPKPAPTPTATGIDERTERKRAMAPQPRRATAAPTADVRERSREEARREAVRQMKLSRRGRA